MKYESSFFIVLKEVNRFLIQIRRLKDEQNKIIHIDFANGVE